MNREITPLNEEQTMATQKTTAIETYKQHREDIARVLDWLDMEMDRHESEAKSEPRNWGYAGSIGHVREQLIEILAFIAPHEVKDIEDLLSECR